MWPRNAGPLRSKASRSADAVNWLRLGLLAHGQLPAGYCPPPDLACRTLSETGLEVLVSEAEKGNFTLTDLSVAVPTLETVFISLTGKDLRE